MPMSKIFCPMALASPATIFYLTLLTEYSQGTSGTLDLFGRVPNQIYNNFDTANTSLDPLVLSGTAEKNWLSLGLSSSGDQPTPNTVETSAEINYMSSNGKGELSYLGRDLIESQQLNEQINSRTFKHSEHKNHANEFSSLTRPQWPAWSEENEPRHIDAEPRSNSQSTQTNPNKPALPRVNFRLGNSAGPSKIETELIAHKPSKSGTINGFNELTRHWSLQSGKIRPLFHNYDPKTIHSGNNFRNEMDFGHPSASKYKNPFWTEYTSIMPLERMDGQNFQEVNFKLGLHNRFEKVNSELSLAPETHRLNPMSTLGHTGHALNSKVGGSMKILENNQSKGKRKKSAVQEASTEKLIKGKKTKKTNDDKELPESAFRYNKNKGGVVIMSPEIVAFRDALMELVDLEKPLIQSDLFKIYLSKIEKLQDDEIKISIKNVLNLIKERYSNYEREYFYVLNYEVMNFLKVKKSEGFKLNPHPNDVKLNQLFVRVFLKDIRPLIEAMNFENLAKHLIKVSSVGTNPQLSFAALFSEKLNRTRMGTIT
ncbi:hypothetical protein BY996DRAFT_6420257 [Phakopsora pachyrhizi]|nr:hypothetical protein BY996DRAFT_6420257 [Phakopsora pachyrhizi]